MSKISNQEIIKRYSNALHNLATEEKKLEIIIKDLKKLDELSKKNQEFNKLLLYPLISSFKQREVLNVISIKLKLDKITKNFLFLLSFNKRLMFFDKISDYFINVLSMKKDILNIDVILSKKISREEIGYIQISIDKIQNSLQPKIKKKTKIKFLEDENIISGFIIKSGSEMLDYSTKSKLDKIRDSIK